MIKKSLFFDKRHINFDNHKRKHSKSITDYLSFQLFKIISNEKILNINYLFY